MSTKRKQQAKNYNSAYSSARSKPSPLDHLLWGSINLNTNKTNNLVNVTASGDNVNIGVAAGTTTITGDLRAKKTVDSASLGGSAASTETLTIAESGTLFIIDGTNANVITMPALSTDNVGVFYEFFLNVAVGAAVTTTFVLPGTAVSNFYGHIDLIAGTAANTNSDNAGDTLTLVSATLIGARVKLQCVIDDGTNSTWLATVASTPISTIA